MSKNINRILRILLLASGALTAFAQIPTFTSTSMASYGPIVAPDSIASGWGSGLATATTVSTTLPLPTTLGNVQISITDSTGAKLSAPLYMVSAGQINYLVPANTALGKATVTVTGPTNVTGTLLVSNVAPALITADGTGKGVPAAQVLRATAAGAETFESPFNSGTGSTFITRPINISTASDKVYFILFGTGIRRHSLNPVKATIGGISVPVQYAGAQSQFPGLDQINVGPLPQTLVAKGVADLVVTVDGIPANTVQVAIQ